MLPLLRHIIINQMKLWLVSLICCLTVLTTKAQHNVDDAALWTTIALKKKVNDRLDVELAQKNRFNENLTELGRTSIGLAINYRISPIVSFKIGYTLLARKQLENYYSTRHRINLAFILHQKWGRIGLKYRMLFQARLKDVLTSAYGNIPVWVFRNKITAEYALTKRWNPYVAQELYYPFDQTPEIGFSRSRTFVGTGFNLTRQTSLDFYFLYQKQLHAFNATHRVFVYGIGIEHKF